MFSVLTLATLLAAGPPTEVLRFAMDTRGVPGSWVPGLEDRREDTRLPPQITREQLARVQGLEVDMLRAIAKRMGARAEIVPCSWFDLEKWLLEKRVDLILGSWTPNPKTPEGIAASHQYYEWGLMAAVRADSPVMQLADLEGRVVGHIPDPSIALALGAMRTSLRARFVERRDGDLLFDEVASGKLDALLFDSMYVRWRARRDPGLRVIGEPLNRLGYHVGVRRVDDALLNRVNSAIRELEAAGELEAIRTRWEGGSGP